MSWFHCSTAPKGPPRQACLRTRCPPGFSSTWRRVAEVGVGFIGVVAGRSPRIVPVVVPLPFLGRHLLVGIFSPPRHALVVLCCLSTPPPCPYLSHLPLPLPLPPEPPHVVTPLRPASSDDVHRTCVYKNKTKNQKPKPQDQSRCLCFGQAPRC